jgi:hypothetical protein
MILHHGKTHCSDQMKKPSMRELAWHTQTPNFIWTSLTLTSRNGRRSGQNTQILTFTQSKQTMTFSSQVGDQKEEAFS